MELYLPALLGGPEQASTTSEAAEGDSRRGDSAAPTATELNYMEKYIQSRSTWKSKTGGEPKYEENNIEILR